MYVGLIHVHPRWSCATVPSFLAVCALEIKMYVNYNYVSNLKFTLTFNFLLQRVNNVRKSFAQLHQFYDRSNAPRTYVVGSKFCALVWYTSRQSIGIGSARIVAGASRVVEVASLWFTCYVPIDI